MFSLLHLTIIASYEILCTEKWIWNNGWKCNSNHSASSVCLGIYSLSVFARCAVAYYGLSRQLAI